MLQPRQEPRAQSLRDAPVWLFDLDNTLYPCTANLFDEIDRRMSRFVADFLKIGPDNVPRIVLRRGTGQAQLLRRPQAQ